MPPIRGLGGSSDDLIGCLDIRRPVSKVEMGDLEELYQNAAQLVKGCRQALLLEI